MLLNVNVVKQDLLNKKQFLKILWSEVWKGGISIDTDSGPLWYVLLCCGSRSQDFFTFIQIGSGHTVLTIVYKKVIHSSITDLGSFRSLFNCTYFFAVIESFIPAVLQSARPKKKSYDAEPT